MYQYKNSIGLSALLLLLQACGGSNPTPVDATSAPAAPPADQNQLQRYQQCWGYLNAKQFDLLKDCYDTSAVSEQLGYGKDGAISGADAIVGSLQEFAQSSPDVRGEAQLILINGAHAASFQLFKGTNTAPLTDAQGKQAPATNQAFSVSFAHAVEFTADSPKVISERSIIDSVTFASQLGLAKSSRARAVTPGVSSPEIVIAKNDAVEKANLDANTARLAAWNKHDGAGVDTLIADDAVFHDMTSGDHRKKEGAEMNAEDWKSFSNSRVTIRTMWAAGDYVVTIGAFEGTNDGAMPIIGLNKPSGKKLSVPVIEIDKYAGGKLVENWLFFDSKQFPAQLGLTSK